MKADELQIEILEDGTIKTTTSKISMANHKAADLFLEMLAKELGGSVTKQKRSQKSGHVHTGLSHSHDHSH
jgi:hypothetical protein